MDKNKRIKKLEGQIDKIRKLVQNVPPLLIVKKLEEWADEVDDVLDLIHDLSQIKGEK